jgi:hypothetical protein
VNESDQMLSVRDIARALRQPRFRIRAVLRDLEVPRVGRAFAVPSTMLPIVQTEIKKRGWPIRLRRYRFKDESRNAGRRTRT